MENDVEAFKVLKNLQKNKLPGKLHRVTGPLEHHVVLNFQEILQCFFDIFEMSISINKWNYSKQM